MMTIETISSSVEAATRPRAARPWRLVCHNAIHATKPANSIQMNPQSATSWWSLIAMSDTPGASRSSRYAAAPLMYAGSVSIATT